MCPRHMNLVINSRPAYVGLQQHAYVVCDCFLRGSALGSARDPPCIHDPTKGKDRGGPAGVKSMVDLGLLSGAAPCFIQSRCGGRQLADKISAQPRPSAGCADFEAGVSRRALRDCIARAAPRSAELSRQPLGGWSACAARTRRWASRSCRGRSRELPRRPRHACARCMCVATRARALSRGCSRAGAAHRLAGCGITPKTLA